MENTETNQDKMTEICIS